jgi:hypothetical protein
VALVFTIHGKAEAAGSKRAFVRGGRAQVVDANPRAKGWKSLVQDAALAAVERWADQHDGLCPPPPFFGDAALILDAIEYRPRPKGHYTSRGDLSADGRRKPWPTSAPDRGKVLRGLEDGLAGVLYRDDAQIVDGRVSKRWGPVAKTLVIVARADDRTDLLERWRALEAIAAQEAVHQEGAAA